MKTPTLWKYTILISSIVKMTSSSVVVVADSVAMTTTTTTTTANEKAAAESISSSSSSIPKSFDAPFGSYPNLLHITPEEREPFSPVVFFPEKLTGNKATKIENIAVKDHRQSNEELASKEAIEQRRLQRQSQNPLKKLQQLMTKEKDPDNRSWQDCWGIGKYDENRDGGMYASDLFDDLDNTIDGYGGRRTVHLGMDLGGPVGTPVYAFCDGIVHSVGYNPELGDYGHVVVVEHVWGNGKRCWALYGHLGASALTINNKGWKRFLPHQHKALLQPGDKIQKGQILGRMGDIDENGGWIHPHLHFQLSTKPPDQPHDMPGASSIKDREEALQQYPDPRYVLGPMY